MAGHAIVNLRTDVHNAAQAFGLPDTFEARFAKGQLGARDVGVSLQRLAPGTTAPFGHRHKEQPEELYVVIAGGGTISLDGDEHPVATWDAIRVDAPVVRSFAAGPDGLEYLAFGRIEPGDDAELVQTG